MFRLRLFRKGGVAGGHVTFLWLFQVALTLNTHEGGHITLSFCVGPLDVSAGVGYWDKFFPT